MFFIPGNTTNALQLQGEDEFCCTASPTKSIQAEEMGWSNQRTAVNQKKEEQRVKEPVLAAGRRQLHHQVFTFFLAHEQLLTAEKECHDL